MTQKDKFTSFITSTGGKHVTRRSLVKGAAGVSVAAAASTAFAVPMINAQDAAPVTFWTTHTSIGFDALTQIGADFNAQSESSVVEVIQRPPAEVDDSSSLITAVRGGEGPDVYLLDRFIVAERAAQGLLQDLGGLLEDSGENPDLSEKYVDFSAAEATYNGTPYALPFDTDVRALFYNTRMLSEAGVDLAAWDPANGVLTLDQVAEVANSLNVEDGANFSQVGFVPYFAQGHNYTWGFMFGGDYFNYENCELTPDDEEVLAAAQWVYDYSANTDADKLYAFIQTAMRPGAPPTDNPFLQERLAMMINGNWMFQQFRNEIPDVEVGYTYLPVPTDGMESTTWAGGWSGVVPQGAQNVEGGYEFLQYLCGPEGSRTYTEMNNNLPVLRELLEDTSLFDENLTWFVNELFPSTRNRPPLPVGARYWRELENAWQAIYLNTSEPADALATAKENTQVDLEAGGYCPIAQ
jgi:multiple sugar transport system substrate-binding protein